MEADPVRRLLVAVGAGHTYKYDISDLGKAIAPVAMATTGDKAIEAVPGPGLAYDPTGGRMVAWAGGADVYTLDPDVKVWTKHAGGGAAPTKANSQGTYGRFRHAGGDLYIAVNRTSENVFFFKLAAKPGANILTPAKNPKSIANTLPARNLQGRRIRHNSGFPWSVP